MNHERFMFWFTIITSLIGVIAAVIQLYEYGWKRTRLAVVAVFCGACSVALFCWSIPMSPSVPFNQTRETSNGPAPDVPVQNRQTSIQQPPYTSIEQGRMPSAIADRSPIDKPQYFVSVAGVEAKARGEEWVKFAKSFEADLKLRSKALARRFPNPQSTPQEDIELSEDGIVILFPSGNEVRSDNENIDAAITKAEAYRLFLENCNTENIPLKPNQELQTTVQSAIQSRTFNPGEVFFFEDFSKTTDGELPVNWSSDSLLVKYVKNRKVLATFAQEKSHTVHVSNVEFPENFSWEWSIHTNPRDFEWAPVTYNMTVGSMTAKLYMQLNDSIPSYSQASVSLNNSRANVPYGELQNRLVKFVLEKKGAVFKLYVDDRLRLISRDEMYQSGKGFIFTAETRHSDWSFELIRVEGKAE